MRVEVEVGWCGRGRGGRGGGWREGEGSGAWWDGVKPVGVVRAHVTTLEKSQHFLSL